MWAAILPPADLLAAGPAPDLAGEPLAHAGAAELRAAGASA